MKWQKRGLIFSPGGEGGWMNSHAQVPTPLAGDGFIRVYFSSRPEPGLSLTTFVDVDADDPRRVLRLNRSPVLELGKPGTFDEHGIMPSCAVRDGAKVLLYYSGWSRGTSVPYTNSTGLAVSDDGGETFRKVSEGPVLGKGLHDPYSATSPCVLKAGGAWHMWYCSGTGWLKIGDKYEHTYDIKHARSGDGVVWAAAGGDAAVEQRTQYEALTRPYVVAAAAGGYHMWFCYRGSHSFRDGEDAYRIGYARSADLARWRRDDDGPVVVPSEAGWDSRMVAYPAVVESGGRALMFYNGNGFGAGGFGYATSAEE